MRFSRHLPVDGWQKCVHEACIFDNYGEFCAARALDRSDSVDWWLRNDPALVKLPTPVGGFEPDFVVRRRWGRHYVTSLLEIKGEFLWSSPEQPDRIKLDAAAAWVRKANEVLADSRYELIAVGDQEALTATHFGDLRSAAPLYEGPERT